ncbi:protein windbeutel [Sabethes cyaneus]|uniref:protein windbeutel n=1 Tax=Sabethes cyaneus TaxID=53552 RepID=UPI00237ED00E|nr:protein windbeutel [Sabethes cyaneus]
MNIFFYILPLSFHIIQSSASKGCLELDELIFDKIVRRFKYVLVKFDVAFPYGDNHEAFTGLALDAHDIDDLLFALVSIKDYGDKENTALGQRFNIPKKYPVITLFNNSSLSSFKIFPYEDKVTVDNLRKFVNSHTDLYISLPGCLKEIDELAIMFGSVGNSKEANDIIVEVMKKEHLYSTEKTQFSFNLYLMLMKKMTQVKETVAQFIDTEKTRVRKLLTEKISANKKNELNIKLNIMESFLKHSHVVNNVPSDEL